MATDLVDGAQSPTFTWVYHSFNGLVSRFKPTKLFGLLLSDPLTNSLSIDCAEFDTGISDLPEECLVYIFQYLEHKDLGKCENVCKLWKSLIGDWPQLWRQVNIEQTSGVHNDPSYGLLDSEHNKLVSYVNHLVSMSARIESLSLNVTRYDEDTYSVIAFLISSGCCANLKSTRIKWTEECSYGETPGFDQSFIFYLSTLELMAKFCPDITNLKTQFNWTFDSVNYLTKFRNLRVLDILCVPRVHTIQKWHIDKILCHLQNLCVFHLAVTLMPNLVQKFSLISKSLRVLDISNCVNLLITEMDLPNLQKLDARGLLCHRRVAILHKTFCLFDVLRNGCPVLTTINGQKCNPSQDGFGIPLSNQCTMHLCYCHNHRNRSTN